MSESNQVYYLDSWKLDNPSTQEPSNNNLFNISSSRPVLDSNNYLYLRVTVWVDVSGRLWFSYIGVISINGIMIHRRCPDDALILIGSDWPKLVVGQIKILSSVLVIIRIILLYKNSWQSTQHFLLNQSILKLSMFNYFSLQPLLIILN